MPRPHNVFSPMKIFSAKKIAIITVVILAATGVMASAETAGNTFSTVNGNGTEQSYQALFEAYQRLQGELQQNPFDAPVVIRSRIEQGKATGNVYAVMEHPFSSVSALFNSTQQWCDASTLHLNIKFCSTSPIQDNQANLTMFVGDKGYQDPEQAYRLDYRYRITARTPRFIQIQLAADSGPLDSKDYDITVEAIPLDNGASFIHFSYSARYGVLSRLLLKAYLATAGRNKIGFTTEGVDHNGNPIYIKGMQGMVERNSMRYFLALQSYLDSLTYPPAAQFEAGLNEWFRYTLKYKDQLYEVDRREYIDDKRRAHAARLHLANSRTEKSEENQAEF